ncbi:PD-(D/E)XK motif protein [Herpetosiphon llansteffanensis]|uniref:PD-(D/E)XK motif protein n=1 Tax=Herpetosiphon llansteffanensis TaxID=2094568 RepID=UPI0013DF9C08|nr:PD-(D/E)XK motif protein [Herpetosiphon llansteffanensis]
MTLIFDPWSDMAPAPNRQIVRRRVKIEVDFALFWVQDHEGRPGLLIEISKLIPNPLFKEAKINIRDIYVDVVEFNDENIRALLIKLEYQQNKDVFLKLCLDLIDHIKIHHQKNDIFQIVCKRLKKWQSLLSTKKNNLLSKNEIQGLYAELYFIDNMLEKNLLSENELIQGWKGPEKKHQDFIIDDIAIEVKSLAGDQRDKVRITSEDQLYTHLDQLYLQVYFLSETQNHGESLNTITKRIISKLEYNATRDLFELKLEFAGYIDISDYDSPLFKVKDEYTYIIRDDFPRITRKIIPEGIESVTYDIVLSSIEKFRTNKLTIME